MEEECASSIQIAFLHRDMNGAGRANLLSNGEDPIKWIEATNECNAACTEEEEDDDEHEQSFLILPFLGGEMCQSDCVTMTSRKGGTGIAV